jgi:hypothetical protein
MNALPLYSFWKLWKDNQERVWAEPFYSRDPSSARKAHAEAKRFGWSASGQFHRNVSDLSAHDGSRSVVIAEGTDELDVPRQEQYFQR